MKSVAASWLFRACFYYLRKMITDGSIRLELIAKAEDVFVRADKTRIGQVISNLINNAIKFTQQESIIL
jgi:signal transduction histidine kinase